MLKSIKDFFNPKQETFPKPPREFCNPPKYSAFKKIYDEVDTIEIVNSLLNNNTLNFKDKEENIEGIAPIIISPFETEGLLEKKLLNKIDSLEKDNLKLKEEIKRLNDLIAHFEMDDDNKEKKSTMYLGDGTYMEISEYR